MSNSSVEKTLSTAMTTIAPSSLAPPPMNSTHAECALKNIVYVLCRRCQSLTKFSSCLFGGHKDGRDICINQFNFRKGVDKVAPVCEGMIFNSRKQDPVRVDVSTAETHTTLSDKALVGSDTSKRGKTKRLITHNPVVDKFTEWYSPAADRLTLSGTKSTSSSSSSSSSSSDETPLSTSTRRVTFAQVRLESCCALEAPIIFLLGHVDSDASVSAMVHRALADHLKSIARQPTPIDSLSPFYQPDDDCCEEDGGRMDVDSEMSEMLHGDAGNVATRAASGSRFAVPISLSEEDHQTSRDTKVGN
jgi:hypothetical protein